MGHLARKTSDSRVRNVLRRVRTFKNWYKIVLPFNRFFTGVQHLRLRNGSSAYVRDVRSIDVNILADVLGNREYPLERMHLPEDAVVFDLGGNIGTFALEVRRVCPKARITAYEPHPGNCAMYALNAPFAKLVPRAAAGRTGWAFIEDGRNFVGLRLVPDGGLPVKAESLDDILKGAHRVDLLKIDIEGSEYELMENVSAASLRKVRRIIMEMHDVPGFDDLSWAGDMLHKHEFKTNWIDPLGVIYGERE